MFWHFLGWKNKFFQNCSKLPKNHFRTIKILFFFQIFCNYKDGWVGETKSGKFQIFFEPFPNYLIFLTSLRSPIIGEAPKMFKIFPLIFLATNFSINSLDYFYFIETTNFSADSLLLRFRMCGQNLPPSPHTHTNIRKPSLLGLNWSIFIWQSLLWHFENGQKLGIPYTSILVSRPYSKEENSETDFPDL